ncbi:hypothetical protein AMET1_1415 [Methanonatronarchaeum thermophilum]|uniref:CcmD family protein n=1 Tax=Methanonatronarchaeum thermophilum TaxID=1927129 RepID=A0A1Y3GGJ6_9EURY|nr:CcmD family protein [Methanonatronarchaeum thermophilum]OUJ18496.1 hypothetical protein AMET1_1415 [Methanonatronarchaeum thermophilum]
MEDLTLLSAAYLIVWIVIAGYLFWIKKKQDKINKEIEVLKSEN